MERDTTELRTITRDDLVGWDLGHGMQYGSRYKVMVYEGKSTVSFPGQKVYENGRKVTSLMRRSQ